MEVYNVHKEQLIESIQQKIKAVDSKCRELAKQIYSYSDERRYQLEKERDKEQQQLSQLQLIKDRTDKEREETIKLINFIKEQEDSLKRDLSEKQRTNSMLEKQIIFVEEKQKEQAPHIQQYLIEKYKNKKSNQNIKYAKDKLKNLEQIYQKQCKQVEYQYNLVTLMKQKLKTLKQANHEEHRKYKENQQSKMTLETLNKETNTFRLSGLPNKTQQSLSEESIVYSIK